MNLPVLLVVMLFSRVPCRYIRSDFCNRLYRDEKINFYHYYFIFYKPANGASPAADELPGHSARCIRAALAGGPKCRRTVPDTRCNNKRGGGVPGNGHGANQPVWACYLCHRYGREPYYRELGPRLKIFA